MVVWESLENKEQVSDAVGAFMHNESLRKQEEIMGNVLEDDKECKKTMWSIL